MKLSVPIHRLKRQARLMSRKEGIPLHQALDRVAAREGFHQWSLLSHRVAEPLPVADLLAQFDSGDMVLIAARPGHGKTRLCLQLVVAAAAAGRQAAFFSLEYTQTEVLAGLTQLGGDAAKFHVDCSDEISASTIEACFGTAQPGSLIVVDYLQLLDQDRRKPPLEQQVRALRDLAKRQGIVIVCISQIDRRYDATTRPLPSLDDVRLPNPLELSLFDKACFLQDSALQVLSVS